MNSQTSSPPQRRVFATGKLGPRSLMDLPTRVLPIYDEDQLRENGEKVCAPRGYHGPFVNAPLYDAVGGMWTGMADCELCYNTRNVASEMVAKAARGAA